jgi:hypothetical protein
VRMAQAIEACVEESGGICVVKPGQLQLRKPVTGVPALAVTYGEDHHDALVGEPAGGE